MSSLKAFCSVSFEITASVVRKASMVHMLGWIMPDPLAMPPSVTVFPPISSSTASSFSQVSVVMMALAAAVPFSREPFFSPART